MCLRGWSRTRQAFAERDLPLRANVPKRSNRSCFPKQDFEIDLETFSCTCSAGHVTTDLHTQGHGPRGDLRQSFRFAAAVCDLCPLRSQCVSASRGRGRMVTLHPQAGLLQAARAFQSSEAAVPCRQLRQTAEHRIARLVQLGLRQARCVGRQKTALQLHMTATVANFPRILAARPDPTISGWL